MKVHRNCCGLDVDKQTIAACLIREDGSGNTCKEKRRFGMMTRDLRGLAQWLRGAEVSAVAMEATGVYWGPVWNVLERAGLHLLLRNPEHYKAIRGKKTDLKDGERIAEQLQDGRFKAASFLAPSSDSRRSDPLSRQVGGAPILRRLPYSETSGAVQHQTRLGGQQRVGRQWYSDVAGLAERGDQPGMPRGLDQEATPRKDSRTAARAGRVSMPSSLSAPRHGR